MSAHLGYGAVLSGNGTMSRRRRLIAIAASLALAGGVLAACGGDDDGSSDGGDGSVSKEDYIQEADQICAQGTADIAQQAIDKYGTAQPSLDQVKSFARDVVAPTLQKQVDQLRALEPPKGDGATVNEIFDAAEDGINQLEKDPNLLAEPGTGGAFDEANERAQEYGFQQCGSA